MEHFKHNHDIAQNSDMDKFAKVNKKENACCKLIHNMYVFNKK